MMTEDEAHSKIRALEKAAMNGDQFAVVALVSAMRRTSRAIETLMGTCNPEDGSLAGPNVAEFVLELDRLTLELAGRLE